MQIKNKGFWSVFKAEVKTIIFTPSKLLWSLGIPLFIFYLYASIFGNGILRDLPLAVLDNDKSSLSRELTRQLNANATIDLSEHINDEQTGNKLIRTGKVFGWIIIPNNFQRDLSIGKPVNVILYLNNNHLTPAGLINKAFNQTVGSFSATAKINVLMKTGSSVEQAKNNVQPIAIDNRTLFNPYINYSYYLCLSLFPMALQLTVMIITLYTLGSVLKNNKGRELYELSDYNVWKAYLGKVVPYTIIFSILVSLMTNYLFVYQGIPIKVSVAGIYLLTLLLVIVYQLIAVFFVTICKDFRSLASLGGGYSALSFSFSGYTFPQEGMPLGIKVLDMIFPFASYVRLLTNTAIKGMPIQNSIWYLLGLLLFAVIGLLSLPKFGLMLEKGYYEKK